MFARSIIMGTVLGVALAAGIWLSMSITDREPPPLTTATVLPQATPVPAFSLIDQDGAPVDASVFRGQWDLVFFGFTHCPDVCPLTLKVLASARQRLAEDGVQPLPRIVLVSVDPARDTPEKIRAYVSNFGDGVIGLTGEEDEIRRLADALYIFYDKRDNGTDNYLVDHSAVVLVIDPEGRYHALFSSPHRIENFVSDLPAIMGS